MLETFRKLLLYLGLSQKALNEPLSDQICEDPNSPEVQLILYLNSIEPSFYDDLNEASKNMDQAKVKTLGPFAMALYAVLQKGWKAEAKRDNALKRGDQLKGRDQLGCFSGSFLLFRGALMKKEWVEDWKK